MNLQRLEQYIDSVREIEMLENRINELKEKAVVADSVKDGSRWPYNTHITIVRGTDIKTVEKLREIQATLSKRRTALHIELAEIEMFLSCVHDSQIRQIIELRYIRGLSLNTVAQKIYGYPCGDRARKKITRFFKKF